MLRILKNKVNHKKITLLLSEPNIGFVIGNGTSRKHVSLSGLKGKTYGCNSLYTEFHPDVLVAVDDKISQHIQKSGYSKYNVFYTRKPFGDSGALPLGYHYKNWSSGSNAIQIAVKNKHNTIVLLGFDFGDKNNNYNNIYNGTEFYKDTGSLTNNQWINQIDKIIKSKERIQFIIFIGNETSKKVRQLKENKNVMIISHNEFSINNIMESNNEHK